jgi:dienelactone hydrolase
MLDKAQFSRAIRYLAVAVAISVALSCMTAQSQESVSQPNLEPLSGVYELPGRRFIYIQRWPGDPRKLGYTDEAGQLRALTYSSPNVFAAGPGLLNFTPPQLQITFVPGHDGAIARLVRQKKNMRPETAARNTAYREQPSRFQNAGLAISGTLFLPPGAGVHPAIVLLHGTGPADRYSVLPIAHFLVTHGIALLGYDKRGAGETPGDWRTTSLEDLAGDAAAAVRFLAGRKEIDAQRIGLFGASQGGWVAPLAASLSKQIALVITVSGPGMSPAEVELQRLTRELRSRGFGDGAIDDAVALVKLADDVSRNKARWEVFEQALHNAEGEKWLRYTSLPSSPDSWLLEHWRRMPLDYDAASEIAMLHVPVLALFGDLDQTLLPDKNAEAWKEALAKGGNRDSEVKIFRGANHMLLEAKSGTEEEFPRLQRFVPEFQSTLLAWLRAHGLALR